MDVKIFRMNFHRKYFKSSCASICLETLTMNDVLYQTFKTFVSETYSMLSFEFICDQSFIFYSNFSLVFAILSREKRISYCHYDNKKKNKKLGHIEYKIFESANIFASNMVIYTYQ